MKRINFRIEDEKFDELKKYTQERGMTMTGLIKIALKNFLKTKQND